MVNFILHLFPSIGNDAPFPKQIESAVFFILFFFLDSGRHVDSLYILQLKKYTNTYIYLILRNSFKELCMLLFFPWIKFEIVFFLYFYVILYLITFCFLLVDNFILQEIFHQLESVRSDKVNRNCWFRFLAFGRPVDSLYIIQMKKYANNSIYLILKNSFKEPCICFFMNKIWNCIFFFLFMQFWVFGYIMFSSCYLARNFP